MTELFVTPAAAILNENPTAPFKEIRSIVCKSLLTEFNTVEPVRVYEKEGREHTTYDRISFLHQLLTNCMDGCFYSLPGNKVFYYPGDLVESLVPYSVFYFREHTVVDGKHIGSLYCYTKEQANSTPAVPLMRLNYPAELLPAAEILSLLESFRDDTVDYYCSEQIAQVEYFYRPGMTVVFEILLTKQVVPQVVVLVEDRIYLIHHLHRNSTIRDICTAIGCFPDISIDVSGMSPFDTIQFDFFSYVEPAFLDMPLHLVDGRSINLYTIAFADAMK